jgi:hypothetical protein
VKSTYYRAEKPAPLTQSTAMIQVLHFCRERHSFQVCCELVCPGRKCAYLCLYNKKMNCGGAFTIAPPLFLLLYNSKLPQHTTCKRVEQRLRGFHTVEFPFYGVCQCSRRRPSSYSNLTPPGLLPANYSVLTYVFGLHFALPSVVLALSLPTCTDKPRERQICV